MPQTVEEIRAKITALEQQKGTLQFKLKDVDTSAPERARLNAQLRELDFGLQSLRVDLQGKLTSEGLL